MNLTKKQKKIMTFVVFIATVALILTSMAPFLAAIF